MAKYNHRFIAIDSETGGLPSKTKKTVATIDIALTELAMVVIDNETLEILDKQSWLIKPYDPSLIFDKGAEQVSGISKAMCEADGLDLEIVYKAFLKVLKENKIGSKKPILVMQNKGFDTPFLENMFILFGDKLDRYITRVEDTLEWARYKWIEKPKFNLGSIADYCGLEIEQAHRALPDTVLTAEIWIHFMKCLRGEGSSTTEKESTYRENFKF